MNDNKSKNWKFYIEKKANVHDVKMLKTFPSPLKTLR